MSEIIVQGRIYNHVHVIVDGQEGTHSFAHVSVKRNLNTLGSIFTITFPNRWISSPDKFSLVAGKRIRVILKEVNVLIDGFIEGISNDVDKDSHSITVTGRDKTGILIDCSPSSFPEYNNLTLREIAEKICAQFDIKIFDLAKDNFKFAKEKFRPAETVFNFLNRLSKQRGLLINSTPIAGGGLTLANVGQYTYKDEKLDYLNILNCSTNVNISEVFSKYTVISQTNLVTNIDGEQGEIEQETNVAATLSDPTARRKVGPNKYVERPLTLMAEKQSTNEQAAARVAWEHAKRLGEMLKISVLVNGWVTRDIDPTTGKFVPWRVNTKIKADYPHGGLSGTYLISSCEYLYGAGESIKTQLTLTHEDAFKPSPQAKARPSEVFNIDFTREQALQYEKANKLKRGAVVKADLTTEDQP